MLVSPELTVLPHTAVCSDHASPQGRGQAPAQDGGRTSSSQRTFFIPLLLFHCPVIHSTHTYCSIMSQPLCGARERGEWGVAILRQRQLFKMFLNPHSSDCQSNSVRQEWSTEKQRLRGGRNNRVLSTCLPLCKELGTHLLRGLSNGALKGTCMTEIITPGTEASNPLFLTPPPSLKCENFYLLQL